MFVKVEVTFYGADGGVLAGSAQSDAVVGAARLSDTLDRAQLRAGELIESVTERFTRDIETMRADAR